MGVKFVAFERLCYGIVNTALKRKVGYKIPSLENL